MLEAAQRLFQRGRFGRYCMLSVRCLSLQGAVVSTMLYCILADSWISYLWHLLLYHVMVEHASLSSCFGPTCLLRVRVHECFHLLIFNNSVHVDHWSLFCRPERIKEICYRINRSDPCDPFRWFNATRSVSNSSPCQ